MADFMVYIVVLNWNGWKDTIRCLESLLNMRCQCCRIVVVDNGSRDQSVAMLLEWAGRKHRGVLTLSAGEQLLEAPPSSAFPIMLILSKENRGYAGGNNLGIACALANHAEHIWILNNDTAVETTALDVLLAADANKPGAVWGAQLIDMESGEPQVCGAWIKPWRYRMGFSETNLAKARPEANADYNYDFVTGASVFASADVFRAVGMFNEDYFLYAEEGEWMLRAKAHGIRVAVCWDCVVYHKGAGSAGPASPTQEYYMTRNSLYLFEKFYPRYLLWQMVVYPMWRSLAVIVRGYESPWLLCRSVAIATGHYLLRKKGFYKI